VPQLDGAFDEEIIQYDGPIDGTGGETEETGEEETQEQQVTIEIHY
jgi:hypothetical protein